MAHSLILSLTRQAGWALLLAVVLLGSGCASTESSSSSRGVTPKVEGEALVFGYYPYWLGEDWRSYNFGLIDKLFFFEIGVGGTGAATEQHGWPAQWEELRHRAQETNTPFVPTITIFDRSDFVQLFKDPRQRKLFMDNMLALVQEAGGDGLHLDVEVQQAVSDTVRAGFTQFVQDLRSQLNAQFSGALLSMFAPAFDRADVFDEAALAEEMDYMVVQGYDLHWKGGERAGPLAPVRGWQGNNWEAILARYLEMGVPPEKIIMTVPFYGYEWPTVSAEVGAATRGRGRTLTYAPVDVSEQIGIQASAKERAARYGLERDPESSSPYYAYQDSTGWHQGWFEDAQSLAAKYDFIQENGLGGLAIFPLGYDDGELLRSLR